MFYNGQVSMLFYSTNLFIPDGDPHFVIASVNAEEHTYLCFDVDGEEKDVLMLLQDPDLGMSDKLHLTFG